MNTFFRYAYFQIIRYLTPIRSIFARLKHVSMHLDTSNPGISVSMFKDGSREDDMIELIKRHLPAWGDIVDCGSNIGFYPLLEASLSPNRRKIVCIEPDPRNLVILKKNLSLLKCEYELVEGALVSDSGECHLNVGRAANLNFISESASAIKPSDKIIPVPGRSLDDLIQEYSLNVSFIRMDIEGYETEVFKGGIKFLQDAQPGAVILFETHGPLYPTDGSFEEMMKLMKANGFEIRVLVSSAGSINEVELALGVEATEKIQTDGTIRGMFYNPGYKIACDLARQGHPKAVRYLLLEKTGFSHEDV